MAQFLGCRARVFVFGRLVRSVRCRRPYPTIPTRCLFLSLFLGAVLRAGSSFGTLLFNMMADQKGEFWDYGRTVVW